MSEEEGKKKPKLRGWVGRKAGAEEISIGREAGIAEISGAVDSKIKQAIEKGKGKK